MFNEPEWLKLIFLLADTQHWLDEMARNAMYQLPVENKKFFFRRSSQLTVTTLAHILERHYYKIPRHPEAGKFHIPVTVILHLIREASRQPASPVPGTNKQQRVLQHTETIGFDQQGNPVSTLTLISDATGAILTAFPGILLSP